MSEIDSRLKFYRHKLATLIENVKDDVELAKKVDTKKELTLAQRHLEDARMRIGVAIAYENEQDPLGQE